MTRPCRRPAEPICRYTASPLLGATPSLMSWQLSENAIEVVLSSVQTYACKMALASRQIIAVGLLYVKLFCVSKRDSIFIKSRQTEGK